MARLHGSLPIGPPPTPRDAPASLLVLEVLGGAPPGEGRAREERGPFREKADGRRFPLSSLQHCTLELGSYIKDLSVVHNDLSSIVILDNSPGAYRSHPGRVGLSTAPSVKGRGGWMGGASSPSGCKAHLQPPFPKSCLPPAKRSGCHTALDPMFVMTATL